MARCLEVEIGIGRAGALSTGPPATEPSIEPGRELREK
jgi:hypothetical protein